MACFKPLTGWYGPKKLASGRTPVVFKRDQTWAHAQEVQIACGRCIGCRLERSRQWATRCMHEASLWDMNCSVTLTYSDEFLPINSSLVPADTQKFIKRLRKEWCVDRGYDDFGNRFARRLSFFLCGEYGGQFQRPHYHVLLFGVWFGDSRPFKKSQAGFQLYRSAVLDKLWPFGHADIGELSFESAAYAARYVLDKVTGDPAEEHYRGRVPEFVRMSLRPAIGLNWFRRFQHDVYPSDEAVVGGRSGRAPEYYDGLRRREEWFDESERSFLEKAKKARVEKARLTASERTPERLAVREQVARSRVNLYKK